MVFRKFRLLPITVSVLIVLFSVHLVDLGSKAYAASKEALSKDDDKISTTFTSENDPDQDGVPLSFISHGKDKLMAQMIFENSELELLESLKARHIEMKEKHKELSKREQILKVTEQKIADKINEMKKIKQNIKDLIAEQEQVEERKMQSLVKTYSVMKAKDAASIFNGMDDLILLQIFARMKENTTAAILAKMNQDKTRKITKMLAAAGDEFRMKIADRLAGKAQ